MYISGAHLKFAGNHGNHTNLVALMLPPKFELELHGDEAKIVEIVF